MDDPEMEVICFWYPQRCIVPRLLAGDKAMLLEPPDHCQATVLVCSVSLYGVWDAA